MIALSTYSIERMGTSVFYAPYCGPNRAWKPAKDHGTKSTEKL